MIGRIKATTALWWFCIVVVAAMLVEFITNVVLIGFTIVGSWWLVRKAASWCFGGTRRSHEVSADKAMEVTPTSVVFSKAR